MAVEYRCCETEFFIRIMIIVLLVVFAGLMSGLTLGLMSLSLVDLEVLAKSGTPQDRKHAGTVLSRNSWCYDDFVKFTVITNVYSIIYVNFVLLFFVVTEKILPVVKNQHLLLCTLLICNAAAMEVHLNSYVKLNIVYSIFKMNIMGFMCWFFQALPIFLDSLVVAWGAILISVTLILLFGEVSTFFFVISSHVE